MNTDATATNGGAGTSGGPGLMSGGMGGSSAGAGGGGTHGWHYACPVFATGSRAEGDLVTTVRLPSDVPPEKWVLRGVAIVLNYVPPASST